MNGQRYTAKIETREFFFSIEDRKPGELSITMYNTPYTVIEREGKWRNGSGNLFEMAQHLIDAVVSAAYTE